VKKLKPQRVEWGQIERFLQSAEKNENARVILGHITLRKRRDAAEEK